LAGEGSAMDLQARTLPSRSWSASQAPFRDAGWDKNMAILALLCEYRTGGTSSNHPHAMSSARALDIDSLKSRKIPGSAAQTCTDWTWDRVASPSVRPRIAGRSAASRPCSRRVGSASAQARRHLCTGGWSPRNAARRGPAPLSHHKQPGCDL